MKEKQDIKLQHRALIYFALAYNMLIIIEYLLNNYIFMKLNVIFPDLSNTWISILQNIGLQMFTFFINDKE